MAQFTSQAKIRRARQFFIGQTAPTHPTASTPQGDVNRQTYRRGLLPPGTIYRSLCCSAYKYERDTCREYRRIHKKKCLHSSVLIFRQKRENKEAELVNFIYRFDITYLCLTVNEK